MTLQQLRYAVAAAEAGSLNQAAQKLYISQPSLTSALQSLEKELGITIFHRSGRGVSLTADGAEFLTGARSVLAQADELSRRYADDQVRKKFGVSTQHYSFAVKAFVELARRYDVSKYELAIRETRTMEVITDVAGHRSEIGILYLSDFNRRPMQKLIHDSGLAFTPLIECAAYVYLWKGHPLAGRPQIAFEDLADYPCLSFEQGDGASFYLAEEILSTSEYPRIIKACDRATMLNLMVGLNGYTLCSGIISEELNGDDYMAIPYVSDAADPERVMQIGWIGRRNTVLSRMAEEYLEDIRAVLGLSEGNRTGDSDVYPIPTDGKGV